MANKSTKEFLSKAKVLEKMGNKIPGFGKAFKEFSGELEKVLDLAKKGGGDHSRSRSYTKPSSSSAESKDLLKKSKTSGLFGQIKALRKIGEEDYFTEKEQGTRKGMAYGFGLLGLKDLGKELHSAFHVIKRGASSGKTRKKNLDFVTKMKAGKAKAASSRASLGNLSLSPNTSKATKIAANALSSSSTKSPEEPEITSMGPRRSSVASVMATGGARKLSNQSKEERKEDIDYREKLYLLMEEYFKLFHRDLSKLANGGGKGLGLFGKAGALALLWASIKRTAKGLGKGILSLGSFLGRKALPLAGIAGGAIGMRDAYKRVGSKEAQNSSFFGGGKGESFKNSRGASYLEGAGSGALAGSQIGLLLGGPIGAAIGAGIGGVTGLITTAFNDNKLKKAVSNFFGGIKAMFGKAWAWLKNLVLAPLEKTKRTIEKTKGVVTSGAQHLVRGGVMTYNKVKTARDNIYGSAAESTNYFGNELALKPFQAAALPGNAIQESGLNPTINEKNPKVKGSSGGFGSMQWTGSRKKDLLSWAEKNNLNPNLLETQNKFAVHELKGPEKLALKALRNTKTPEEASKVVSDMYLRPAKETANLEARAFHTNKTLEALNSSFISTIAPALSNPTLNIPKSTQSQYYANQNIVDIRQQQHHALMSKMSSSLDTQNALTKKTTNQSTPNFNISTGKSAPRSLMDDISSVFFVDGMFLNLLL